MPKLKKVIEAEETLDTPTGDSTPVLTDKEILTDLYAKMKMYGINSISDVEVKLARL